MGFTGIEVPSEYPLEFLEGPHFYMTSIMVGEDEVFGIGFSDIPDIYIGYEFSEEEWASTREYINKCADILGKIRSRIAQYAKDWEGNYTISF